VDYYGDNDPGVCAWLRELIATGELPAGEVDERDIGEVRPEEVRGYRACHFFAGIGGWPYALHLAGWPADRSVWTASCPCQSFSSAGKRKGTDDERHLWPVLSALVRECRPHVVFGEQVASKLGYEWLDGVRADLESQGYAVGAADLAAAGVGAPHIRQRLFWVANAHGRGWHEPAVHLQPGRPRQAIPDAAGASVACRVDDATSTGCEGNRSGPLQRHRVVVASESGIVTDPWRPFALIPCRDGKWRRVPGSPTGPEPGLHPLAHGLPGRVGLLRGYGNAIVPQVAAAFVRAVRETLGF
jgi:DNA (cytosine-5)-methyltransferase 1